MGLAGGQRPHPRAVIFDLDRCLIDSRAAWRYCIEESIAAATGRRIDASALVAEYHTRPWRDALAIFVPEPTESARCAGLCQTMYERSAMKKLLVHEGIGMALDSLRGERIELGAISRLPHSDAVKQVQSTGLDRFLAVVAAAPWNPRDQIVRCLSFLEAEASDSAFVSAESQDLDEGSAAGLAGYFAEWAAREGNSQWGGAAVEAPSGMRERFLRDWPARSHQR